jgi:hypothetical protein
MFLILQVVIVFLVAASMSLSLAHRRAGGLFRNRFHSPGYRRCDLNYEHAHD